MGWMAPLRHLSAKLLGPRQFRYLDQYNLGPSCIGMSLGEGPRDSQETFGRACQIGHTVLRSTTAPTDALSSHQRSRKRADRRRAIELLADCPQEGCTEAIPRRPCP